MGLGEVTTTGVFNVKDMVAYGELFFAAVNVDDSVTKSKVDGVYGCRHTLNDGTHATDTHVHGGFRGCRPERRVKTGRLRMARGRPQTAHGRLRKAPPFVVHDWLPGARRLVWPTSQVG